MRAGACYPYPAGGRRGLGGLDAVGGEVELGRERRVAGAELEGFGDDLVVDGLVALPDRGRALGGRDDRRHYRQGGQQRQDREGAAPPPGAAARGVPGGAEERPAGGRQRGVAAGRVLPAGGGGVDGGQPSRPVQVGGVPAVAVPGVGVGDDLAVQGPVQLVFPQPVPELFPGLQQGVMGDLDAVLPEDEQAVGAEDVDHRVDVCRVGVSGEPRSVRPHRRRANWPSGVMTVSWVKTRRAASFCGLARVS